MGGTGRELFRHDRGDHLLAGIEAERTFDGDENVVGRRQIDVPAPDQTAAAGGDDFLHLFDADIDPGQHFHGVGGTGRRGDRARGGLGNGQPVRRHDRDDDHRGAVARNAADAMLVDDDRVSAISIACRPAPSPATRASSSPLVMKLAEPIRNAAISMSE